MMLATAANLAIKDFVYDKRVFVCLIIALAAILSPLEVLAGLKYGLVDALRHQLLDNPHIREIVSASNRDFTPGFFARLAQRRDVAFVIPRTRSLAATINLKRQGSAAIVAAELIPTGIGDPLLRGKRMPTDTHGIVLSRSAAQKLGVDAGDSVVGSVSRTVEGKHENARIPLMVADISDAFPRDGAFGVLDLLLALEDYSDGFAVPIFGWPGAPFQEPRRYAGFRLYAGSLEDVEDLSASLRRQGIDIRNHAEEIEFVLRVDRNLSIMLTIIASIGGAGYLVSLGINLWANIERKRKSFGIMRLIGLVNRDLVAVPVIQAALIAGGGVFASNLVFVVVAEVINRFYSTGLLGNQPICRLSARQCIAIGALTLATSLLSAALGGWRVARVAPAEGFWSDG